MKLRLKIYTDTPGKKYVVSHAIVTDRKRELLQIFIMSDEETRQITLSAAAFNELPCSFFEETGAAPRPTARAPEEARTRH